MTSLTVAPAALPSALMRSSEYDCAAKRRDPEMATLNIVGGAWNGLASDGCRCAARTISHSPLPMPGMISAPARSTPSSGSKRLGVGAGVVGALSAWGVRAGRRCAHSGGRSSVGSSDSTAASMRAAATPSTMAWCTLA